MPSDSGLSSFIRQVRHSETFHSFCGAVAVVVYIQAGWYLIVGDWAFNAASWVLEFVPVTANPEDLFHLLGLIIVGVVEGEKHPLTNTQDLTHMFELLGTAVERLFWAVRFRFWVEALGAVVVWFIAARLVWSQAESQEDDAGQD